MTDLSNVTTPVEWVVTHAVATGPIAVVRRLRLGARRELYFRAVTWHIDTAQRELIGYWGSLEDAVQNVYGLYERSLPPQFLEARGKTAREPHALTKPKPPPVPVRQEAPPERPASVRQEAPRPQPARPRQLAMAGR